MRISFILAVSVSFILFSISAQTENVEFTEEQRNILEELRPKPRLWGELNELMLQVIDDAKINEVIDCSFINENSSPTEKIHQNILYRDYSWNIYKSSHGSTCIELIRPIFGFLNEKESKVLLLASKGVGFEKLGLWEEVGIYYEYIKSINDIKIADKEFNYNEPPLDKSEIEIKADINLLKKLKNQLISPLTYFTYQIYENSQKCNGQYNKSKTACLESAPKYDKDNMTLTFSFLREYREIDENSNKKKLADNSITNLAINLGIDGETKGLMQSVLESYDIPITIKKNSLILNNKSICIRILLYVGYDVKLFSYYGLRDCNGDIKVIKEQKAYVL